jgi:hypothetical protein
MISADTTGSSAEKSYGRSGKVCLDLEAEAEAEAAIEARPLALERQILAVVDNMVPTEEMGGRYEYDRTRTRRR